MPASRAAPNSRTPRHLWVVGVLALLWNSMGAWDYFMSQTENQAYMSAFTPEQLAFFHALPVWAVSAWATGIWGGVLGTLLLLGRRRLSVWVFLASLAGAVVTTFHTYAVADGMRIMGGAGSLAFAAMIVLVALGLFLYARAMDKRGVLV